MAGSARLERKKHAKEVYIAVRSDGISGSGTKSNPLNGSTAAKLDALWADSSKIPAHAHIHLGPGVFKKDVSATWVMRPGWTIEGAGECSTSFQLVGSMSGVNYGIALFYSDPNNTTDGTTISRVTLDCNWPTLAFTSDQGGLGSHVVTDGITTSGSPVLATAGITANAGSGFMVSDISRTLTGSGIPSDTVILRNPRTTVASGSNLAALPQSTINVISTADFASTGSFQVEINNGGIQTITYAGKTSTSFTRCSGGTGTIFFPGNVFTLTQIVMGNKSTLVPVNATATAASVPVTIGGEKNCKANGVAICGSHTRLRHVRCINSYGSMANGQEAFALAISAPSGSGAERPSTDNIIDSCLVELPSGNYGNPFLLAGGSYRKVHYMTNSVVKNCRAYGNHTGMRGGFTSGGVNFAGLKDCRIIDNDFIDCEAMAYIDTFSCQNIMVARNTGVRCVSGISFLQNASSDRGSWTKKNISIINNGIVLQNRLRSGQKTGINVSGSTTTGITVTGNRIRYFANGLGTDSGVFGIHLSNYSNGTITNNIVDSLASNLNELATNYMIRGNRTWSGASLLEVGGLRHVPLTDSKTAATATPR